MYRNIELIKTGERIEYGLNTVEFQVHNSQRCKDLCPWGGEFIASNGYVLMSECHPEADANILFLQGDNETRDDEICYASVEHYDGYKEAVEEYNMEFGIPPILVV